MTTQVFISYARLDNEVPASARPLPGFVTQLHEYLDDQLRQLPHPRPVLWRDTGNIERTDQFTAILDGEVARSDFLIVVLSYNWLHSDWCKRELDTFSRRWASEGEANARRRILLVNKTPVDRNDRPPLLQGQEGHDFFAFDREQHQGARVRPYFDVGRIQDDGFVREVRALASKLQRLAAAEAPNRPESRYIPAPARRAAPTNGRAVFVARPADDMRRAYERIGNELRSRGFLVVPDSEIPNDDHAVGFINQALAAAELSVHALGEKRGFAPPEQDPIVGLQLVLAADRAREAAAPGNGERNGAPAFHRILWAPKILEDPVAPPPAAERDPLAVLARFGEHVIEGDKILGDNLSRFIDFLIHHLDQTAPRQARAAMPIAAGAKVYIDHEAKDMGYATELAGALQQRSITPVIPVLQGTKTETTALNRRLMRACDAIALCWANATEGWAISHASRLDEWRQLGRKEKFSSVLLLGPPSDAFKARRVKIKPREVDSVVDLTNCETVSPQDLDPWLGPYGGGAIAGPAVD